MACLMLSQASLLAVWSVVGWSFLTLRLALLALGIGVWSRLWDQSDSVPAADMACLLALLSLLIAVPLAVLRNGSAGAHRYRQISLAALIGVVTAAGLMLPVVRQFSRPYDVRYLSEMCGIVTATAVTTLAAAILMLGSRLSASHLAYMGLTVGSAGWLLSATIMGEKLTAWVVILLHTSLVAGSLAVWRLCGVRWQIERLRQP
jgi:hypothetical protein